MERYEEGARPAVPGGVAAVDDRLDEVSEDIGYMCDGGGDLAKSP